MPTSTATMTVPAATKKGKVSVSTKNVSSKNAIVTLRSLYPRAARAFLQRNVTLTHSLLLSAFSIIEPPLTPSPDTLSSHRRKWDILRITLETTIYTSGSTTGDLIESLQSLLNLSPSSLITAMHVRSLQLFTPANRGKPSSEFLPSQILVALVLASVKLGCAQVGREMIEDWLSRRAESGNVLKEQVKDDIEGYEKVLETYCLHVLPRLEDWDYAREFLLYEGELPRDRRTYLIESLQILHTQHLVNLETMRERQKQSLAPSMSSSRTPTPRPSTDRGPSPSPSSASISSNSTHTVVPLTPRPLPISSSLTSLTSTLRPQSPSRSRQSNSTVVAHRHSQSTTPLPMPPSAPQMPATSISPPSLLALLKSTIVPHFTTSNLTFFVLMFVVPLLSFLLRLRHRRFRIRGTAIKSRGNAAEEAKKRLKAGWWAEIRKAVGDTIKMAGSGLV